MPAGAVTALGHVSIRIEAGDYVAISGPSGCGKSTLLHLLGCVDRPSGGSLVFEGRDVAGLTESERSRIRLTRIGFVFQRFFLLPMLTAWENVELPQSEAGVPKGDRRARTRELLEVTAFPQPLDFAEMFRTQYGPTIAAGKNAAKDGRARQLDEALDAVFAEASIGEPGSARFEMEYLLATGRRV